MNEMRFLVVAHDAMWDGLVEFFDQRNCDLRLIPPDEPADPNDGSYYIVVPRSLDPIPPTWHVADNITGTQVSRDFTSVTEADAACRELNLQAGPGGRYGVYTHLGERAP